MLMVHDNRLTMRVVFTLGLERLIDWSWSTFFYSYFEL